MAGIPNNDRKLGAEVRRMTLKMIQRILADEANEKYDEKFRRDVLLKLTTNVLPRINEHTGESGEPINVNIVNYGNNIALPIHSAPISDSTSTETARGC